MATKTVLYMGFSFSDEYINELRSSVVQMLGVTQEQPLAYAITDSKSSMDRQYYLKHEGVQLLNFDPHKGGKNQNWGGFEKWLQDIHDKTSPPKRWGGDIQRGLSLMTGVEGSRNRIVWCVYADETGETSDENLSNFFKDEANFDIEVCPSKFQDANHPDTLQRWLRTTLTSTPAALVLTPYRDNRPQAMLAAINECNVEDRTSLVAWTSDRGELENQMRKDAVRASEAARTLP